MTNKEKSNVLGVFPTGVGLYKLDLELPKNLDKKIKNYKKLAYNTDLGFHGYNNYDKEGKGSCMDDLGLKDLKKHMQTHLESYCEEIGFKYGVINQDWLVKLPKEGRTDQMNFTKSYMSGIYYPFECDETSPLVLLDIKAMVLANARQEDKSMTNYEANIVKGTHFSTSSVSIKPEKGLLMIFPSYMYHYVPPTKKERITIQFSSMREDLVVE